MSLTDKAKDKAKKNPTWLLGVLVLAHLLLISLNRVPSQPNLRYLQYVAMSGLTPFAWVASHSVGSIKGAWDHYFALRGARDENDWLKAERVRMENQLREQQEKNRLSEQNNVLQQWQSLNQYGGVTATVIARDANEFFNTLVIDRGTVHGVQKDMPVVAAQGGLVGRVIATSPLASRILLLTDERHGTGAEVLGQTADTRLLGVVEGKSQSLCEMRFIVAPDKIEAGEQVITSGQDGIYPKGLLVGRVKGTGTISAPQSVEIEPVAPLGKLETVSVLLIPLERLRAPVDELTKEEEKEKQDKASERRRSGAGR